MCAVKYVSVKLSNFVIIAWHEEDGRDHITDTCYFGVNPDKTRESLSDTGIKQVYMPCCGIFLLAVVVYC